jgi:hypothetical protein
MTLTEFLLARIAEDDEIGCLGEGEYSTCADLTERRVVECEAKRRIVAEHIENGGYCETCSDGYHGFDCEGGWEEPFPCPTLRALALPYADHPSFQEEWRT